MHETKSTAAKRRLRQTFHHKSGLLLRRFLFRRFILIRLLLLFRNLLAVVQNLHVRAESLVVLVLHDFPDVNVPHLEVQFVIGLGVDGKPILAVDLLAPGGELGIQMLVACLFLEATMSGTVFP